MSEIGLQVDELRKRALVLRQGDWSDGREDALLMEDAADIIESLRNRLQDGGIVKDHKHWTRESRWFELFGTPENAARTIHNKHLTYDVLDQCDDCPYVSDECYESYGVCAMQEYDTLLEWLKGGAE